MAIYGLNGKISTVDLHNEIIRFMKAKGGTVSNPQVAAFVFDRFGIEFSQINHVMWALRQCRSNVVKAGQGHSKLIEAGDDK